MNHARTLCICVSLYTSPPKEGEGGENEEFRGLGEEEREEVML